MKRATSSCQKIDGFFKPKNRQEQEIGNDDDCATCSNVQAETCSSDGSSGDATVLTLTPVVQSKVSGPNYPDISTLGAGDFRDEHIKMTPLRGYWENLDDFSFPSREIAGVKRKLSAKWLKKYTWLRYSVSRDALYCVHCLLFGGADLKEKSFTTSPVNDWSNLHNFAKRHENTTSHTTHAQSSQYFLDIKSLKKEPITSLLSEKMKEDTVQNRKILKEIIDVLILCGRQNISIRGHIEEKSNFIAILQKLAEQNQVLRNHLSNPLAKVKYTSASIQNQLIEICGNVIREQIVSACNQSSYFALLCDEATDSSTNEQVSVCVRFVDFSRNNVTIREEFLGFVKAADTRGETLADLFLETLERYGVVVEQMCAQGYDGAANMSGIRKGVQARIRQRIPDAQYVHCKAHVLNLAIVHSCTDPSVRTMMATVQDISFSFHYSAKKLSRFHEELAENQNAQEAMNGKTKLKTLCETRWFSRADSHYTFISAFPVVVDALEHLRDNGDTKSGQQLAAILRFDFIIALIVSNHVLQGIVPLTGMLQGTAFDLLEAVKECRTVIRLLEDERNDFAVFDELYEKAVDLAGTVGVQPSRPREARNQRHRANPEVMDTKQYWPVSLYCKFLDHLISELTDRLVKPEERFKAEFLLPSRTTELDQLRAVQIFAAYESHVGEQEEFLQEVQRWRARWRVFADEKPSQLCQTLEVTNKQLYPNIHKILQILATMPPTTATAERSFSVLKRLKSYLRATMGEERLSALALLHIHRDMPIDVGTVIDIFDGQKNRKMLLH